MYMHYEANMYLCVIIFVLCFLKAIVKLNKA